MWVCGIITSVSDLARKLRYVNVYFTNVPPFRWKY
jgi:hypothetical protein